MSPFSNIFIKSRWFSVTNVLKRWCVFLCITFYWTIDIISRTRCPSVKIKFYKRVPRKLVQKWKEGLLASSKKLVLDSDQMVPNIWIFIFSYFPCKILEKEFPFHGSKWGFLKGYPQSYYRNKKRNPKRAQKSWSWILVRWFIKTLFWLRDTVNSDLSSYMRQR